MKDEFDKNWPLEFDEIWVPLLQTEGQWDYEKIKNEMHDLVFSLKQVSIVYSELTNGQLSKPLYYADTIIAINNDEIQKSYNEGYKEGYDDCKEEKKSLIDIIKNNKKIKQLRDINNCPICNGKGELDNAQAWDDGQQNSECPYCPVFKEGYLNGFKEAMKIVQAFLIK